MSDMYHDLMRLSFKGIPVPVDYPFHTKATKQLGAEFRRLEAIRVSAIKDQHIVYEKAMRIHQEANE